MPIIPVVINGRTYLINQLQVKYFTHTEDDPSKLRIILTDDEILVCDTPTWEEFTKAAGIRPSNIVVPVPTPIFQK